MLGCASSLHLLRRLPYPETFTVIVVRQLVLAFAFFSVMASAQLPPLDRNVIVLDAAHGGVDRGGSFNGIFEKDLTLSLTAYLRVSLAGRGFAVLATREADLSLGPDQRAAAANHLRPAACIIVHADPVGNGIHIATSSLPPPATAHDPAAAVPWETAQSSYVPQSLHLANTLGVSLLQAKLPVLLTRTALRLLDNLTCPAVAVEVSPLQSVGGRLTPVADAAYQRRIAEALAEALLLWRNRSLPASAAGGAR